MPHCRYRRDNVPKTFPQRRVSDQHLVWKRLRPGLFVARAHGSKLDHLLSRVVLCKINSDNKNPHFAGVLSPLPDSNRGPPPYHGDCGPPRPGLGSPLHMLLLLQIPRFERAVTTGLESPRMDPPDLQLVPKTCPQPAGWW
jgi:hypothetical protein